MVLILTSIRVFFMELLARLLGFLPIWICDYCGRGFYTMRGCQFHEGRAHPTRPWYCTTEAMK